MAALDTRTMPAFSATEGTYETVRLAFEEIGASVRDATNAAWEEGRFAWELWEAMAEAGLFADAAKPETQAIARLAPAFEGLSYGLGGSGAMIAPIVQAGMVIPTIRDHAPEPVRSAYLERLSRPDELAAYAITETHGGTAAFAPQVKLERRGEDFVLSGRKWHITNAPDATVLVVWACDADGEDMAAALIDTDWDGVEIRRDGDPVGTCNAPVASIFLDEVHVPADHVLAHGEGRRALQQGMLGERLSGPFAVLGTLRYMIDLALDFVMDREVAGTPLSGHQHLQAKIVDLRMRHDTSRAIVMDALGRAASGQRFAAQASQIKMYVARQLMEAGLECAQIMGSYGVQRELGLARAALDGLCMTIAGGTEEAHKMVIFKEMVAERRAARSA